MKNSLLIILTFMATCPWICRADDEILTYDDIAVRLYDFERLATPPIEGERGGAWTSADRGGRYDAATGKYVNWGANGDGGGFMRREGDCYVAAEVDGPGVLWRFWSAMPGAGYVRIFIDGNEKPVIDKPFREYFAEFEKIYPNLAVTLSRGRNRFIPVPFQKSCKVLLGPNWGKYFHITYSKFPPGTKIESFAGFNDEIHASLKKANTVWGARGQNPHKPDKGAKVVRQEMTLAAGEKSELKIDGARAIRAINIHPTLPEDVTAREDALREMTLAIKWDGEPTPSVWAPLGDFFATSPGVNLYKALPIGMTEDGFYCYWYMPFEKGAVIELTNDGKEPRQLKIEVETAPLTKPTGELLRFHAWWHGDDYTGVDKERFTTGDRRPDWPLLVTEDRGRYVGMTQHIWKFGGWWGEGDEKFFVDGEKYPSTIGTGSEDYIGYAWAANPPFVTFESALACNTHLLPNAQKDTSVNRFHVCDDVPFMKSFEGVIEKYVPNYDRQGRPCLFDTTVYWYAMPGSKSPYKQVALESRVHPRPTVKKPPPPKPLDPDAIEGESLKVVRCDGGRHWIQDMRNYPGGKWSRGKHLIWTGGKKGQSIAIEFDVPKSGEAEVKVRLTKACDYGIFQLYLDEKKVGGPIDLYDPDVVPTDTISLGRHQLRKGRHTLGAEAIGCNTKARDLSVGTYLFGLDYMTVAYQDDLAGRILANTGVRGGLIVHLGCGDGELTAALHAGESYVVHGLDSDADKVARSRSHIQSLGVYGPVSVDRFDGKHLPYIDNLVNLIVVQDRYGVPTEEVMRVLAPLGVAYVKTDGEWTKTVKPWPDEIDEWTHYMHSPNNNAVADDTVVDSPRRLQWNGGPKWTRSHETMSGMNAMVSAAGRIFYVMDEGPSCSIQLPPEWKLVARDAFNGVVLWRRDIPLWQTHLWPLKAGPATIPRRLVAVGDSVYVTLGLAEPVTALDAATGKTVKTYKGTEGTEEILVSDGVLFLRVNEDFKPDVFKPQNEHCWTESARAMGVIGIWKPSDRQYVTAIDASTGRELWRVESPVARLTLTVDADSVYFHTGGYLVCLNRETGKPRWRQEEVGKFNLLNTRHPPTLVSYDDVLLCQHHAKISAYSREKGKLLWKSSHPRSGHVSPGDTLVIAGLVWSAGTGANKFIGKDIHTGEVKSEFSPPKMTWFHPRCYRSKGTSRYLLASRTGIEVVDIKNEKVSVNHWTRGSCLYGIMPANGLIYTGPHPCACLLETKTSGFNALAPARKSGDTWRETSDSDRRQKGPAYGDVSSESLDMSSAWPMYRHDPARSGYAPISVPMKPRKLWTVDIGGRLSSLVSARGKVFAVTPETHTVHALDAGGGGQIWKYTCGGRVDSPPTLHGGKVIFGSHDGYVYCLRARDGELVWRFLAAPNHQRMVSYGQVESVWPVHGSVLVMNDVVYFVTGRSAFLDGGLRFYKLHAETGELLAMSKIDENDPATGKNLQKLQGGWIGLTMPVANADILSSNGKRIFMRSQPFDFDGNRLRIAPDLDVRRQDRDDAHLFSPVGLLDDAWHHRSYWTYGVTAVYGWHVWFEAAKHAPSGRILSFDNDVIYGFARKPQFLAQAPTIEYQLYKADRRPAVDGPARVQKSASEHTKREWNQTQWLSRGRLYKPEQLTALGYHWIRPDIPIQVRAMVLTRDILFLAGPPDVIDEVDLWHNPDDAKLKRKAAEQTEAWRGRSGGSLWAVSTTDGNRVDCVDLEAPPVFDAMIAADNKLFLSLMNGKVICYGGGTQ